MKQFLFGYGSLINAESAARTLKRPLHQNEVTPAILANYERNWTLWDNVVSEELQKPVKAVFLNIIPHAQSFLNGVLIEISEQELAYFAVREKNYCCIDVTEHVSVDLKNAEKNFSKVLTFVGKEEYLALNEADEDCAIFTQYIQIVEKGVNSLGPAFAAVFQETTRESSFTKIEGRYTFIDPSQQQAR